MSDPFEIFSTAVANLTGLRPDLERSDQVRRTFDERVLATGDPPHVYIDRFNTSAQEQMLVIQQIVVNETSFFRNRPQLDTLTHRLLPRLVGRGPIRMLSAACSTGEEAYTLAIIALEAGLGPDTVEILGADISPAVLARARTAVYSAWSLREVSPARRDRWFERRGQRFALRDEVKRLVSFEQANLVAPGGRWARGPWDLALCRNMLMYLTLDAARAVVAKLHSALRVDGWLFLGHADSMRGLSDTFRVCEEDGTFFYQKTEEGLGAAAIAAGPWIGRGASTARTAPELAPAPELDGEWHSAIADSVERIDRLGRRKRDPVRPPTEAPVALDPLEAPRELLAREQYAKALDAVLEIGGNSPDAILLRAALQCHAGRLEEAEASCAALLHRDDTNAGAHFILGLCRSERDPKGAMGELRTAVFLDPEFALPRLHLGRLARRVGDFAMARASLEAALTLLVREDAARLALFGGGFDREALMDLCRRELASVREVS